MSDVERRLLRAGRALRDLEFEPPRLPLAVPASVERSARIPARALPVLVVLGGLAVMAGVLGRDVGTDPVPEQAGVVVAASTPLRTSTGGAPATDEAVGPESGTGAVSVSATSWSDDRTRTLTAHEEMVMISSLVPPRIVPADEPVTAASLRRF